MAALQEILELARGLFLRDPVPFLVSASELIAPSGEFTLWIMGKPTPLFFHFPAHLFAVAFETIVKAAAG